MIGKLSFLLGNGRVIVGIFAYWLGVHCRLNRKDYWAIDLGFLKLLWM